MPLRHLLVTIAALLVVGSVPPPAQASTPVVLEDRAGDVRGRALTPHQQELADIERATFRVVDGRLRAVVQLVRIAAPVREDVVQEAGLSAAISTRYGGMVLSVGGDSTGRRSFSIEASGGTESDRCRGLSVRTRPAKERFVFWVPVRCLRVGDRVLRSMSVSAGVTIDHASGDLEGRDRLRGREDLPLS